MIGADRFPAMRSWIQRIGLALVTALIAAAFSPASPAQAATCDFVASPSGSDAAAGSEAAPLQTASELVSRLAPGQAGCLRAGSYVLTSSLRLTEPGTTLRSYPGERATVSGRVRIEATAVGATLEGLMLDGRNPEGLSPLIHASGAVVRDNEITNFHTHICIAVDRYPGAETPTGVVIENNRIHDCGRLPATNYDHGVYVSRAIGTVIRGNWIYDNADRGVQLYSQAQESVVTGNVIDGNGQGVLFGGEQTNPSSNNVVENNVISNSVLRDNVESTWGGQPGTGNVVRNNCIGGGGYDEGDGGILAAAQPGFVSVANSIGTPKFVDRANGNLTLVPGSPCGGVAKVGEPASETEAGRIDLRARRGKVALDESIALYGHAPAGEVIALKVERKGSWKTVKTVTPSANGSFAAKLRARHAGQMRLKATAAAVRGSKAIKVKVAPGTE